MIDKLKKIESQELLELLNKKDIWNSLDIDYHTPRVERLWTQYGEYRILLHAIHPCEEGESLLHTHPWKSAVHYLGSEKNGYYEHGIGFRKSSTAKRIEIINNKVIPKDFVDNNQMLSKQEYKSGCYYDIMDENAVHYVRPVNGIAYTVMLISDIQWERNKIDVMKTLSPLSDDRKDDLLNLIKYFYIEK